MIQMELYMRIKMKKLFVEYGVTAGRYRARAKMSLTSASVGRDGVEAGCKMIDGVEVGRDGELGLSEMGIWWCMA